MADLSPDRQQAVERLKGVLTLYAGLKPPRVAVNFDDLRLALSALDELTTERDELEKAPGRREALTWLRSCTPAEREAAAFYADIESMRAAVDAQRARADAAERDVAKLQVAYDLVKSGHGWCRCHDVLMPTLAERNTLRTQLAAAEAERARLREALEDIAEPLLALKRQADADGTALSEMAYQVANDPSHLRQLARAAIAPQPAPEGRDG